MTDQQILALYAAGDPAATEAVQRQYGGYCAAIAGRILTDPRDVEECLNDLWLQAWKILPQQQTDHLKGWLGTVARNCALGRYRQLKTAPLTAEESELELASALAGMPAEQMESRALGECISAFLRQQSQPNRVAFVRRYWYGDSVEQVAQHMGWSAGKTKTVLFRLRNKLQSHLTKEGFLNGE